MMSTDTYIQSGKLFCMLTFEHTRTHLTLEHMTYIQTSYAILLHLVSFLLHEMSNIHNVLALLSMLFMDQMEIICTVYSTIQTHNSLFGTRIMLLIVVYANCWIFDDAYIDTIHFNIEWNKLFINFIVVIVYFSWIFFVHSSNKFELIGNNAHTYMWVEWYP